MKLTKYLCNALAIKDTFQMMEFICWLIFMKIVSQVVKILKKFLIKKTVIKKIVTIEKIVIIDKNCNN